MKDPALSEDVHWLAPGLVEQFIIDVFEKIGVPRDEAAVCADVLLDADMRGITSHGVSRLKPIYYDRIVWTAFGKRRLYLFYRAVCSSCNLRVVFV